MRSSGVVPHAVFFLSAANSPVYFPRQERVAGIAGVRNFRESPMLGLEVGELYLPRAEIAAGRQRTFCKVLNAVNKTLYLRDSI